MADVDPQSLQHMVHTSIIQDYTPEGIRIAHVLLNVYWTSATRLARDRKTSDSGEGMSQGLFSLQNAIHFRDILYFFFYHFPLRLFVLSPLQNLTLFCLVVSLWGRKYRPSSDAGLVQHRPSICQLLCLFVYNIHICDWRVWLLGHPSYQCAG